MRAHDVTLVVNDRERNKLPLDLVGRSAVVRTGVDLSGYQASEGATVATLPAEPVVGMLGSMSYAPNVRAVRWFGRHVWPLVQRSVPEARWLIVGRDPVRSVRRQARRAGVTVTGFVDDVRAYLAAMRVYVCPIREPIGVQTKLIEALAAARPAVVTPQAAGGIEYDDPPPFLVAGSPREFADAVVRLLRDVSAAAALGGRARAMACAKYAAEEQWRQVENWLMGQPGTAARPTPRTVVDGDRARRGVLAREVARI
jgi:glycosyltransferase involved in cell wall biosynthesis